MVHPPRDLACLVSLSLVVLSLAAPTQVHAEVADIALKKLAARSDRIVVARVIKVEDGPAQFQRSGSEFPPVKVATAEVLETWKGDPVKEVRYIATPTQPCDTASAEKGERVVLFLERSKDSPDLIAHIGCGRMLIENVEDRKYAVVPDEVKLPGGMPTISRKPTERAVELDALRTLVKQAVQPSRPASP